MYLLFMYNDIMLYLKNPILSIQGYDKTTAKKHLLAFALAAPIAAFFSYFGLTRVSSMG